MKGCVRSACDGTLFCEGDVKGGNGDGNGIDNGGKVGKDRDVACNCFIRFFLWYCRFCRKRRLITEDLSLRSFSESSESGFEKT